MDSHVEWTVESKQNEFVMMMIDVRVQSVEKLQNDRE